MCDVWRCAKRHVFVLGCVGLVASFILLGAITDRLADGDVEENDVEYEEYVEMLMNDTKYVEDEGAAVDNWRNLTELEIAGLSALGRRLFLQDETAMRASGLHTNKTYKILVWKYGPAIERRLLYQYGKKRLGPFKSCSVSNCALSYDHSLLASADAILFHLHRTLGPGSLPAGGTRPPKQRWVFLTDESPYNTFLDHRAHNQLANYDGIFNWSMTYRMDSDVPVPYGRTLRLSESERRQRRHDSGKDYASTKTKMAAIMGSNCGGFNKRWSYVKKLQKYMPVDTYGHCGKLKCPGHFDTDCPLLNDYKFYLSFENSNCREYLTEKVWWHGYAKGAVPVILGAPRNDARKLLPPNSYIHSDEFDSPGDLARYLLYLNSTDHEYNRYFDWKREFAVVNEHGYFRSPNYHYCRLCEALNYNNSSEKTYRRMEAFWSVKRDCRVPGMTVVDSLLDALLS